jgi:hypothetical protein
MIGGMLLAMTDGSYDKEKAKDVSRSGWILFCTKTRRTIRGSFYKISPKAGSFRGELLGLVAICMLALAVARFFCLDVVPGRICCNDIAALKQSSKARQWVWIGMKHSDLH